MNILNNRNKRTNIFKAVALCLIAAVSFTFVSCDDDMDIQQSYPFTVEVMPVPNKVTKGQTVEIRCELKKEGDFANTLYTIRYFQFEGEGKLKMDNGITFLPNDRYLLENGKFRLYYTAEGDEAHNFIVVVEDNFGNSFELEFDFNNRNVKDDGLTIALVEMMRVFMTMLCSLLTVCSVSAQISRQEGTDGQAAIYRLPLMERAFLCCRYFEGWHSEKHYPYVGWGHKLLPNEKYSARTMTKRDADELLRKDLRKFVAMFRKFGVDSILLGTLAYNVGPAKLLGSKTIPKSTLIKKLEAGDRNIYREYIAFCNYKGKRHAMLLKRRKAEFALLYIP